LGTSSIFWGTQAQQAQQTLQQQCSNLTAVIDTLYAELASFKAKVALSAFCFLPCFCVSTPCLLATENIYPYVYVTSPC